MKQALKKEVSTDQAVAANDSVAAIAVDQVGAGKTVTVTTRVEKSREAKRKSVEAPKPQTLPSPTDVTVYKPAISIERATADDTTIVKRTRIEYVAAFNSGAAKTARSTLEMCRVVYEAKQSLDAYDFGHFCKDIDLRDNSSTIRKYIAIGKVYPRLIQLAESLPSAWTTIYAITQIPADAFENAIKAGFAFKNLKGKDLNALVKRTQDVKTIADTLNYDQKGKGFTVGKLLFTRKPDMVDWRAMNKALAELEARLPIKFVVSSAANDYVKLVKDAHYDAAKEVVAGAEFKPALWDLGREANAALTSNAVDPRAEQLRRERHAEMLATLRERYPQEK